MRPRIVRQRCIVVLAISLGNYDLARADIYRYVDDHGNVHFSNIPRGHNPTKVTVSGSDGREKYLPASNQSDDPEAPPKTLAPQAKTNRCTIVETKRMDFANVRRVNIRVRLASHADQPTVEKIAREIVESHIAKSAENAVSVMFFAPNTAIDSAWDVAAVDWAPNGRWEDAPLMKTGDYSAHRYYTQYKAEYPTVKPVGLTLAKTLGLLGAPLPQGAKLVARFPGKGEFEDPWERYDIKANRADIEAFFMRAMIAAGWQKHGASMPPLLVFTKGNLMLGVIVETDGSGFTLKGS